MKRKYKTKVVVPEVEPLKAKPLVAEVDTNAEKLAWEKQMEEDRLFLESLIRRQSEENAS